MKNQLNQSKAITLIALVITIIVLLILAGVTIVTLTGDNGLITKASDAQKESLKAEGLEKIQVEIAGSYDNNGQIDTNQLRTNLQHITGITTENDEPITNNTEIKLPMIVKISGNQYLINSNGSTRAKFGIDEYDVATHPETYYGHYVTNYNSPNDAGINAQEGQKWQIFMADDTNIYLIAKTGITAGYIGKKNNKEFRYSSIDSINIGFSNDIIGEYNANTSTTDIPEILLRLNKQAEYHKWMNDSDNQKRNYASEKAAAAMLDTEVWSGYNNTTYAEYAIGGPSLEMFCTAYNLIFTERKLEAIDSNPNNTWGYLIKKDDESPSLGVKGISHSYNYNMSFNCWLASPASYNGLGALYYLGNGAIGFATANGSSYYFQPVICLKSNVHLVENEDGQTYSLELD